MSVQNKPIRTSAEQAPYFKFYVSDFREIVDDWTAEEIGCYIMLLIIHCFTTFFRAVVRRSESPIPAAMSKAACG